LIDGIKRRGEFTMRDSTQESTADPQMTHKLFSKMLCLLWITCA
jgi:hypothetical protein